MNMAVKLVTFAVFAIVAGCCEDYHAHINQSARCPTNGIISIRIGGRHSETHVDETNVVSGSIRSDPVERSQNPRSSAYAIGVQNAQVDKVRIRRDARICAVGYSTVACRERSDVRTVAVRIVSATLTRKVFVVDHANTI